MGMCSLRMKQSLKWLCQVQVCSGSECKGISHFYTLSPIAKILTLQPLPISLTCTCIFPRYFPLSHDYPLSKFHASHSIFYEAAPRAYSTLKENLGLRHLCPPCMCLGPCYLSFSRWELLLLISRKCSSLSC